MNNSVTIKFSKIGGSTGDKPFGTVEFKLNGRALPTMYKARLDRWLDILKLVQSELETPYGVVSFDEADQGCPEIRLQRQNTDVVCTAHHSELSLEPYDEALDGVELVDWPKQVVEYALFSHTVAAAIAELSDILHDQQRADPTEAKRSKAQRLRAAKKARKRESLHR